MCSVWLLESALVSVCAPPIHQFRVYQVQTILLASDGSVNVYYYSFKMVVVVSNADRRGGSRVSKGGCRGFSGDLSAALAKCR